ncbi:MAG: DUF4159 domain-containing protein [Alphaproteobacteria bacterium]|nr:MAG: DUF4159 domain-containing protein [Alphaproteobacteria bacterium]
MLADAPAPSAAGVAALKAYLRQHGLILFDTGVDTAGPAAAQAALQRVAAALDLPPLEPLGPDHVLSHSFYILNQYPGRLSGGEVWVDAGTQGADGAVATTVIGGHDWTAAWAEEPAGAAIGAPGRNRQSELAFRFGINLVVYALTGTYKADQVHVPALLERMER